MRSSNRFPRGLCAWFRHGLKQLPSLGGSPQLLWLTLSNGLPFTTHTVPPGRISPDSSVLEAPVLAAWLPAPLLDTVCVSNSWPVKFAEQHSIQSRLSRLRLVEALLFRIRQMRSPPKIRWQTLAGRQESACLVWRLPGCVVPLKSSLLLPMPPEA